ncbi:hypothetical protein CLU83_4246 [Flavobacterium sp. 1]|nr:hypothetical protein CLU83_4246 [Flavobacterium sp. 1]
MHLQKSDTILHNGIAFFISAEGDNYFLEQKDWAFSTNIVPLSVTIL